MDESKSSAAGSTPPLEFKKPVLIGRVGKLPRKAQSDAAPPLDDAPPAGLSPAPAPPPLPDKKEPRGLLPPAVLLKELSVPIPYKEPRWSALPPEGSNYSLEVLKSGVIVDKIDLSSRPYHVFGRLANCDVVMAHPTISRHHAVLQYRAIAAEEAAAAAGEGSARPAGWYVWDAASTHGTLLNRERVAPERYVRVRVGHMLRFGASTRSYILLGPEWDSEGESGLSVTEMRRRHAELLAAKGCVGPEWDSEGESGLSVTEMRRRHAEMKAERERAAAAAEAARDEEAKRREEGGVDWGMGEDAEEESDLSENPFASTTNEELYLDDPKKTLRGYYEREGLELQYDCQEKGPGQFVCRVELPVEDSRGKALVAEAVHRGKKKEAVVACALEACRILDRHGLLRQAKHESRRRKQRDWSADDYYDSDDDNYLDRTGAVERKRRLRMRRHERQQPDPLTYSDLTQKSEALRARLAGEERRLATLRAAGTAEADPTVDALDSYMSELASHGHSMAQKAEISKLKMEIVKLKSELASTERLTEIAKPASLPALVKQDPAPDTSRLKVQGSIVYGKRMRLKEEMKVNLKRDAVKKVDQDFVEEMDSDEDDRQRDDGIARVEGQEGSKEENEAEAKSDRVEGQKDDKCVDEEADKNVSVAESKDRGITTDQESQCQVKKDSVDTETEDKAEKRVFGPMRPPEDYVVPEGYFQAESDRDLPEIIEDNN